ncbi:hypothetical protein [Pedobacter sp. UYP1]|uniref:hypothetical protein n=1 Tax=Pedobacter sp. UYP1 TaxID=1756396 RepID=UPI003399651A
MSAKIPARTGLILILFVFFKSTVIAQSLSARKINQIGQSLVDQQLLTEKGRAELQRFSKKKPLQVYEGFNKDFLTAIHCPVYFLKSCQDILPGQGIFPITYFDSLLNKNPDFEKECAIKEERYLAANFPNRFDLFNFLSGAAGFYRDNISNTDSTKILAERFGEYFGPAIQPLYRDSTIEFSVSYLEDTNTLQEERVKQARPYLKWINIFKQADILDASDGRMEAKFNNGKEIYTAISHRKMISDIGDLILYHDKSPYYKQQQYMLLDSLTASGFITQETNEKLLGSYKRDTLLNIDDIVPYTKNYMAFDTETEIKPFDFLTREYYGEIPVDKIKGFYELVLKKAALLLNFTYSDLEVHATKEEDQLIMDHGNRQFYIYVKLNGIIYKEELKERELESWINPQNFQFLNHYLEDQNDQRRLYFTKYSFFTGYEPQDKKTLFITLLKENEAKFVKNVYLASRLNACYNGSPGDYNYAAWEYYDTTQRLTRAQLTDVVDFLIKQQLLKTTVDQNRERLVAAKREQNPKSISNILLELPNAFTSGGNSNISGFLNSLDAKIRQLQNRKTNYFTDYSNIYKEEPAHDRSKVSFNLNHKKYQMTVANEDMLWENNLLLNTVNKALMEAKLPYAVYPLPEDSKFFRQDLYGDNYIVLSPDQAADIVRKYGDIFKKEAKTIN